MNLINTQSLTAALQHADIHVRSGALLILGEAGYPCGVEASHAVMDTLEKYGWEGAFCHHSAISNLPIDEEIAQRVVRFLPQLQDKLDSKWGQIMIAEVLFDWLASAPPQTCLNLHKEFYSLTENEADAEHVLKLAEFRISISNFEVETCRNLLDEQIQEALKGEGIVDDTFAFIQALIKRLGELGALDEGQARAWIDGEVTFSEPDFTLEEIQVCMGFEMIKQMGKSIPVEKCFSFLALEIGFLSDCIVDILVANADEALMNSLIREYPDTFQDVQEEFMRVFEKVQIPGLEEKIRDLSLLENDIGMRANLAIIMSVYGSDQGVKYAEETLSDLYGEMESTDIMEVLYAINVIRGKSTPEMDEWRNILTEINEITFKMMSGEIDIPFTDEEFEDEDYFDGDEESQIKTDFHTGFTPFVRAETKIGRNDPCPCGSGKKYKKCCIANAN
jgi:SEC-C motif